MFSQFNYGIVIHGGAGNIQPQQFTKELEQAYHQKMQEALQSGYAILERGGSAVDAVVAAIKVLEDSPFV